MAKGVYIGVEKKPTLTEAYPNDEAGVGIARKVKKMYYGVGNLAKEIKKGYIGIGGVARPFWSWGEPAYYGTISPLNVGSGEPKATTIGNYAIFGGGTDNGGLNWTAPTKTTAYDSDLLKTSPPDLLAGASQVAADSNNNYAIFAGGARTRQESNKGGHDIVTAYDGNLVRYTPPTLAYKSRYMAHSRIKNYAIFSGGFGDVPYTNAYDENLVRSNPSSGRISTFSAFRNHDYFFLVPRSASMSDAYTTYAFDEDFVRSTGPVSDGNLPSGEICFFISGDSVMVQTDTTMDVFDSSFVRTNAPTLIDHENRGGGAVASVQGVAFFAGGGYRPRKNLVDVYDSSFIRNSVNPLSVARSDLDGASIGNYALFGGGTNNNSDPLSIVDCYTLV